MRPKFTKTEREILYKKAEGNCHHCGVKLADTRWHVDHHPVAFRDIEDQTCWGVTDKKDMDNLVASCAACNLSHKFEHARCCGHTQLRCRQTYLIRFLVLVLVCAGGYVAGTQFG
jgi:hypothetical protein